MPFACLSEQSTLTLSGESISSLPQDDSVAALTRLFQPALHATRHGCIPPHGRSRRMQRVQSRSKLRHPTTRAGVESGLTTKRPASTHYLRALQPRDILWYGSSTSRLEGRTELFKFTCHAQPRRVTFHGPSVPDREEVDYKEGHSGLHQSA